MELGLGIAVPLIRRPFETTAVVPGEGVDNLLLEDNGNLLLEDGVSVLMTE